MLTDRLPSEFWHSRIKLNDVAYSFDSLRCAGLAVCVEGSPRVVIGLTKYCEAGYAYCIFFCFERVPAFLIVVSAYFIIWTQHYSFLSL